MNYKTLILHIETSTNICSIALSEENNIIFKKANYSGMNHAALLSDFIKDALGMLQSKFDKLTAVSVSAGPGSYTGLRIGVSTAKGLCYGLNIPLIALSTLQVLAYPVAKKMDEKNEKLLFCPMIDARRMEVYTAFYNIDGQLFRDISADIISAGSFEDILRERSVYFFGNGAEKCKSVLTDKNAHFIDNVFPLAENMVELVLKKFYNNEFEDIAYFEPFYLKEFQATTPKKIF